jgi:uncharacterized protein (DUF1015 family)
MVTFLPFRGLVPRLEKNESIEERVSPPYDVIGPKLLERLRAHERNITQITLGERDGDYSAAANELWGWINSGRLVADQKPSFYLYEQTFDEEGKTLTRTGIMGALRLEDYGTGNIIPHEETFPQVKEDRLNLLRATSAHLESIFCLYDRIDAATMTRIRAGARPRFLHTDQDGVRHRFSQIDDETLVAEIKNIMATKRLLIADGHHRYETALKYASEHPDDERKQHLLVTAVAANDPGMVIRPTHRLIAGVGESPGAKLDEVVKRLNVWETKGVDETIRMMRSCRHTCFGLWLVDGRTLVAEATRPIDESALSSVDAYLAEKLVISRLMKVNSATRVDYDHDLSSVVRKMESGAYEMAILLSPPKVDTIWRVAEEGLKMPRKSTYFWPKIWSGFVVYSMT